MIVINDDLEEFYPKDLIFNVFFPYIFFISYLWDELWVKPIIDILIEQGKKFYCSPVDC
jgi:hypothetical protein